MMFYRFVSKASKPPGFEVSGLEASSCLGGNREAKSINRHEPRADKKVNKHGVKSDTAMRYGKLRVAGGAKCGRSSTELSIESSTAGGRVKHDGGSKTRRVDRSAGSSARS